MTTLQLSDILDHWVVGRTRGLLELQEKSLPGGIRVPAHLVDDVNAHGFPPDRDLHAAAKPVTSVKNSYGNYKIYSFD